MKRFLLLAVIAGVAALGCARATAQGTPQVWATTTIQYTAYCDCVDASFSTGDNDLAAEYYDLNSSGCLSDYLGTYSSCSDLNVADVALSDYFYMDAWIGGSLDEDFSQCPTSGCEYIACCTSCCFYNCLNCNGAPTEPYISAESVAPTATGTCSMGTELDTLMNEYLVPEMFGMPDTSHKQWLPQCGNYTQANLTPYANAFSGGDITDWAIFQSALLNGLAEINGTAVPAGITGVPSHPVPVSPVIDAVYRTPKQNYTQNVSDYHPNETHQDGGAIDFQSNSSDWGAVAGWAEWATGANPGGSITAVCVEPSSVSGAGHVHVDWRPQIPGTPGCGSSYQQNVIPSGWPSH